MPVYVLQFSAERTPWEMQRKRFANWPPAKRIKWTGNIHVNMGSCWLFAAVVRSLSQGPWCADMVFLLVSVWWDTAQAKAGRPLVILILYIVLKSEQSVLVIFTTGPMERERGGGEREREKENLLKLAHSKRFQGWMSAENCCFGVFFVHLKSTCKWLAGAREQWSDVLCHFRVLMKNLLLGYFHTPDRNRLDAIHAIGSVLGFTQEDFHKVRNFSFSFIFLHFYSAYPIHDGHTYKNDVSI